VQSKYLQSWASLPAFLTTCLFQQLSFFMFQIQNPWNDCDKMLLVTNLQQ
jgi:hypothetical protein